MLFRCWLGEKGLAALHRIESAQAVLLIAMSSRWEHEGLTQDTRVAFCQRSSHLWQWKLNVWSQLFINSCSYYTTMCTVSHTNSQHLTAKRWHVNCSRWFEGPAATRRKRGNSAMDDRNLSYCQSSPGRRGGTADAQCLDVLSYLLENLIAARTTKTKNRKTRLSIHIPTFVIMSFTSCDNVNAHKSDVTVDPSINFTR